MKPALVLAEGRQRDGPRQSDPLPPAPRGTPNLLPEEGRHTDHPPPRHRTVPDAQACPQGGTRPTARHRGTGTGPPPPPPS